MRWHVECIIYGPFFNWMMHEVPSGPLRSSVSETVVMVLLSLQHSCVQDGINGEKKNFRRVKKLYFHRDYDTKLNESSSFMTRHNNSMF